MITVRMRGDDIPKFHVVILVTQPDSRGWSQSFIYDNFKEAEEIYDIAKNKCYIMCDTKKGKDVKWKIKKGATIQLLIAVKTHYRHKDKEHFFSDVFLKKIKTA